MKVVVLLENTSCNGKLICEHGLSLYIEANGKKILFDAGQTDAFAKNAEELGIDLDTVDFCVLSHGHYDHGGGLARFFQINKTAPVYAGVQAFDGHYHGERYIGLDRKLDRSRFCFVREKAEIGPGIFLDPMEDRFENAGSQGMQMEQNGIRLPEDFRHEQYLRLREGDREFVLSGCSHRGVVNILQWTRPDVFLGGFHLSKVEDEKQIRQTAETLAGLGAVYYTGHCTGARQFNWMKNALGDRLQPLSTGMTVEL